MWRLAFKSLKRRKARTALTILGITVIVMLSLLFLSVGYSTENKVIPSFQKLNIDLVVLQQTALAAPYSSINESVAWEIQSYPEVSAVYPYIIQVLTLIQGPSRNQSVVINALLPSHVVDFYRVEPVSGSYITDTTNDSIAVGVQAAKVLGLKAGDTATFGSSSTNQINLKVAGIFTTFGTVDDYDINMALPLAQKLFDKESRVSAVILKLYDKAKADEIKNRIEAAHPDLVVKTSDQYVADFSAPIRVLQGSITLISGLAVAAGVFGVSNTMLMAVVERRREIGIMRAIGTGTGQILATFLQESLVLGVVGGSVGILLGIIASNILTIPSLIGITITLDVPIHLAVEALGIALGTALLGGIYPALRAARLRVADALHVS